MVEGIFDIIELDKFEFVEVSMKYEEIKLNISNDKISNYKVFKAP